MSLKNRSSRDIDSLKLIAQAQAGDASAFGELATRYRSRVLQTALRILKNREDAEDAVQEAMLNAYRHLETFRGDSAYGTWLTRIVMNVSLMQLRKKSRRHYVSLEEPVGEELSLSEVLASATPSPEAAIMEKEKVTLLWNWLGELPASLRDITVDRMREELSVDELAARRGISVAAAKSRLLRARHAMLQRAVAGKTTTVTYSSVYSS